jgi:Fur family iron response transcriptional regulator
MSNVRPYSAALERLRSAALRPTRQRMALTRLLFEGDDRHVTAEALHKEARAANVRVSLATVYNTLHQFNAAGLLREVVVDATRSYFDTNTSHHHHFFCEEDRCLVDIPGEELKVVKLPHPPPGTTVTEVDIVIRVRKNPVEKFRTRSERI